MIITTEDYYDYWAYYTEACLRFNIIRTCTSEWFRNNYDEVELSINDS